tara:strand:+ start:1681 stop:2460 length:780 start_codon:yes stop_codon:yes gene_type:complete
MKTLRIKGREKRRRKKTRKFRGGGGNVDVTNKAKGLFSKIVNDIIDDVAEYLGYNLNEEQKKELDIVKNELEDVTTSLAPNVEKAGLDAIGVLPGIGEVVEAGRVMEDVVQSGEKLMDKKDEIENLANTLINDPEMHEKFTENHEVQKKILDRVDESRDHFKNINSMHGDDLKKNIENYVHVDNLKKSIQDPEHINNVFKNPDQFENEINKYVKTDEIEKLKDPEYVKKHATNLVKSNFIKGAQNTQEALSTNHKNEIK